SFASAFNEPEAEPSYLYFLTRQHLWFVLGMLAGVGTGVLAVFLLGKLQARFVPVRLLRLPKLKVRLPPDLTAEVGKWQTYFVPESHRKQVPEDVQRFALAGTFFAMLLAGYLFLVFMAWKFAHFTPALSLCILLGLAADVYAAISFRFPRFVYPV